MSTENQFEPIELDVDLSAVDTQYPVLAKGVYDFDVKSITREENKDKTGFNLKVQFSLVDPAKTYNDKDVAPGLTLTKYYPLQKKEGGSDKFDYRVGLASLIDAVLNTSMENRPKFNSSDLINKRVRANVAVVKNDQDDSLQNEIKKLSYPE